ncbi:phage neck terminator protein [Sporolactobacillus laevolacticus]|uniref:Phage neck terminator protein gp12-like domain-containing protein n=1 Tax=Sporolactobacillus laevolacticus DSM 442 TaxID=1395513 RepID=V6IZ11_9BACL|nr:hypothetical protein [Sporolactobacillus laevolacticus]EST12046.1 hypothetical protein P343_07945 [Sporolactobacillus laevolacticus DSM 442]
MIDYTMINSTLISVIQSRIGHPVIVANGTGPQPDYPFCTFSVITPYLPIGRGEQDPDQLTEHVEAVISFTWHAKRHNEVLNLSIQTASLLKLVSSRQILSDQGIVIVSISNATVRDTFLTVDTERSAGFDLRIRVANVYEDSGTEIIERVSTPTNTNQ